jgi:hypothetical protein
LEKFQSYPFPLLAECPYPTHTDTEREIERERERGVLQRQYAAAGKSFFFFFVLLISFQKIVYAKAGLLNKEDVFLINYNWLDI